MKLLADKTICLRALEPEDLELLYRWENDASLWTLGSTVSPYSYYVLREYIAESHRDIYEQKQQRFMISLRASGETIGTIDLFDFDPHHSRAGVGILIDSAYQRKGYASLAIRLVIDYAFSFLKLNQLYAHIPQENQPSIRLFTACGFTKSGVLREWNSVPGGFTDVVIMQLLNA